MPTSMTSLNLPTSSTTPSSTSTAPQGNEVRPSSRAIADQFCQQYYTVFSSYSRYLYRFYNKSSTQSITETFEDGNSNEEFSKTHQEIHDVISRLFSDAKVQFEHISSQFSQNGGVLIQVTGILSRKGFKESNFTQSFFLAVQERGFFVLNDILNITPRHGTRTSTGNEANNTSAPEVVLQPPTPREDGVLLSTTTTITTPSPDPEQISQILAETKEVLNSTVQSAAITESPPQQQQRQNQEQEQEDESETRVSYAELLRRSSGAPTSHYYRYPREALLAASSGDQTSLTAAPGATGGGGGGGGGGDIAPRTHHHHTKTRSYGDVQGSLATVIGSNSATPPQQSGFLLPSRRRNSMSGSSGFSRNASVFVRDIPSTMEEQDLREIFEQFGTVMSVVIRTGKRDSRFAFVDFAETVGMEQALAADPVSFQGRRLGIQEKKPIVIRNKTRFQNSRSHHHHHSINSTTTGQFSSTRDLSCQPTNIGANADQLYE
eukprot:g2699.t1